MTSEGSREGSILWHVQMWGNVEGGSLYLEIVGSCNSLSHGMPGTRSGVLVADAWFPPADIAISTNIVQLSSFRIVHSESMSILPPLSASELSTLKGRTILITGGASGIGRAAVGLSHSK